MKNNKAVHLVCILDNSGSMGHLAKAVIGNFNTFVKEQKKQEGKAFLTLILFNSTTELIYDRVNIKEVSELTDKEYRVKGSTAMYDAIGSTIERINDKNTLVMIQTDGHENASKKYRKEDMLKLVSQKEDIGWDFLFLGANIDTNAEGSKMGLRNKSSAFLANDLGISDSFVGMDAKAKHYRYMKEMDDNYIPPKDSELSQVKEERKKTKKVKWDKKKEAFVLA